MVVMDVSVPNYVYWINTIKTVTSEQTDSEILYSPSSCEGGAVKEL